MKQDRPSLIKGLIAFVNQSPAVLAIIFVIVGWYLLTLHFPPYMFPRISSIARTIVELHRDGELWVNVWRTSWRVVVAFGSAIIMATFSGIMMGYSKITETGGKPILFIIQTISSVVWCFFAVIWFRANDFAAIFVIFIVGYPIITINVWEGVKNVDLKLESMAKAFNVSKRDIFMGITVPFVLPYLFAGIRSSFSYCWKISILAELMVGVKGTGYWMNYAWGQAEFDEVMAWVVVMVALMLTSEYVFIRPVEAYLMRWRPKRQESA